MVRDIILASSGLLNKTIGGPSVKPYQPKGLWEAATSGRGVLATYKQDEGEALYRRGMYTFIKLTVPPPSMAIFDASNRDQCEVKRLKTNTPLQALMMMNDPTVLEASRVLSQKLVEEKTHLPKKRSTKHFAVIICRRPTNKELSILQDYYTEQLQLFQQKKLDALTTLKCRRISFEWKIGPDISAAIMKVVNMIYNMEEAIVK